MATTLTSQCGLLMQDSPSVFQPGHLFTDIKLSLIIQVFVLVHNIHFFPTETGVTNFPRQGGLSRLIRVYEVLKRDGYIDLQRYFTTLFLMAILVHISQGHIDIVVNPDNTTSTGFELNVKLPQTRSDYLNAMSFNQTWLIFAAKRRDVCCSGCNLCDR